MMPYAAFHVVIVIVLFGVLGKGRAAAMHALNMPWFTRRVLFVLPAFLFFWDFYQVFSSLLLLLLHAAWDMGYNRYTHAHAYSHAHAHICKLKGTATSCTAQIDLNRDCRRTAGLSHQAGGCSSMLCMKQQQCWKARTISVGLPRMHQMVVPERRR